MVVTASAATRASLHIASRVLIATSLGKSASAAMDAATWFVVTVSAATWAGSHDAGIALVATSVDLEASEAMEANAAGASQACMLKSASSGVSAAK